MIGKRLAHRYDILRRIGEGGMAIVYKAHDTLLDRPVAVKVLRPELARDEEFVRRFRREARAAASLSHPNIVAIYDVGRHQGCDYIVMEYVEGRTLKDKIRREAPLPVAVAVSLARQILQALDHAHRHGIIHRDIKPQNILLTRSGQVKLTDLGIARATGSWTLVESRAVLGTAHYISPEQACGRHTGVQSDLYSLGIVLYEMLTGRLPFDGESPVAVAMKHVQEPPPSPRRYNPAVPAALEAIVLKAIEKDPARRYASAGEFLEDLARYRVLSPAAVAAGGDDAAPTLRLDPLPVPHAGEAAAAEPEPPVPAAPAARRHPPRVRRRWPPWLAWSAVLLAVFAAAGGAAYALSLWLNPPVFTLPDLRGRSLEEARRLLAGHGVRVEVVSRVHHPEAPAGTVVAQEPGAGEPVRAGAAVAVTLSEGPQRIPGGMPDLRGLEAREAELRLRALQLQPETVELASEEVPAGRVVEHDPPPGAEVAAGSRVRLFVSSGPPSPVVAMPDLRGRSLDEARQAVADLGLVLRTVASEVSDYPANQVARQAPAPGSLVRRGDAVDLTVSSGNGLVPNRDELTVELAAEPEVQQVAVLVRDERGERVVRSGEHAGGDVLVLTVFWYGDRATVRVLVNGEERQALELER